MMLRSKVVNSEMRIKQVIERYEMYYATIDPTHWLSETPN